MEKQKKRGCKFTVDREGDEVILIADCTFSEFSSSIEENGEYMGSIIEELAKERGITKLVLSQKRNYEYDTEQTKLLNQIARIYAKFVKNKESLNLDRLNQYGNLPQASKYYVTIKTLVFDSLKTDPIGTYVSVLRLERQTRILLTKSVDPSVIDCSKEFLKILSLIEKPLSKTQLIKLAKPYLAGLRVGDREPYRRIFIPTIKPDFMYTKLMSSFPKNAKEIDTYKVSEESEVTIFTLPDSVQYLYHLMPPEFNLSEEKYDLLDQAKKILSEHEPKKSEFVDPERMREVFLNVGHDLIEELAETNGIELTSKEKDLLTSIIVRYTVGFGLIEVLLQDKKIQDITINSPIGHTPIFVVHADYGDCKTNIIPTQKEAESWATKLRMISVRPLDEANPILDTSIVLPGAKARVAVISKPLDPSGLAYAFRRHRDKPWTLPLFIHAKMISSLGAGLVSFLVDGSRTMLVAGTRSAGKTSFLSSILVEIMRRYRIITIEDTLELPTGALRDMGYNIQHMKVASAMTKGTSEVAADTGIRTTLRLGDSCLIIGEVRSKEARALYEAMRVGAMANVVAGTIHGDSPYGVYDRVVNDLEVPKTSFKATDIVIVANPIKSSDGLHKWRRITQITEVRKHWENDPMDEHAFVDLMKYNAKTDQLEPTRDLVEGESEIVKNIAANVNDWAGKWGAVWENILLRAKMKERLVNIAEKESMLDLLEAKFTILANDQFHKISEKVKEERGILDCNRIYLMWDEWLKKAIKNIKSE